MLIVDTYNVLHVTDVLPPEFGELDVDMLARLIGLSRYAGRPTRLVCDGTPGLGLSQGVDRSARHAANPDRPLKIHLPGADVLYAGKGHEADDLIERLLKAEVDTSGKGAGGAGGLLVISSDRRVIRAAQRAGSRTLASPTFLRHIVGDAAARKMPTIPTLRQKIPLDPYSVALWMKEFGYQPDPSQLRRPKR